MINALDYKVNQTVLFTAMSMILNYTSNIKNKQKHKIKYPAYKMKIQY